MVSTRETKILIADAGGLFPADWIYPDDDLFPIGSEAREITNIVAGSLKLDEIIAEKVPQFGQLYSSKFEAKIYLEDDLSGKNIAVYQKGDDNILHGVFFGKIDSCKTDRVGTDRTIVAYDPAYEINSLNVANWWAQFWNNRASATLKQVRDDLMNFVHISSENVTLPNDDLVVTKTVNFTSCTFQQMLKMICELNCCFPHVNRNGNMDYIILDTEETPTDLDGLYEWTNSKFEEYETDAITGVQFFDSDEQLKYTVGTTENAYPISKNIFLYDASTTTLEIVGNVILGYLEDLSYNPASIKMVISDMEMHLGTRVTAEEHTFYIFQNSLSGSQLIEQTVKADGDQVLYNGTAHLDYGELILSQKIARVSQTVEEFYIEYTDYAQQTTTKINQNADRIEFQAGKFSNYQGSYVPTTSNSPASSWTTTALKEEHENEIFYNPTTGKYYKWQKTNNVWGWTETTDINVARNLSSQLSIESGQIVLQSGRLIVETGNFQLDEDGILTAKGAILENAKIESKVGAGVDIQSLEVNQAKISFNEDDAYINYQKKNNHTYLYIYSSEDIRVNADDDLYLLGNGGNSTLSHGIYTTGVYVNGEPLNLLTDQSSVAPIYDAEVSVSVGDYVNISVESDNTIYSTQMTGWVIIEGIDWEYIDGHRVVTCSGLTYVGSYDAICPDFSTDSASISCSGNNYIGLSGNGSLTNVQRTNVYTN